MKIRTGFVSNSSSSSFVVAFPRKPESIADIKEFLFGDRDADGSVTYYDYNVTMDEVARQVFNDMQSVAMTTEEITEELNSGWRYHVDCNTSREMMTLLSKPTIFAKTKYSGHNPEALRKLVELELETKLKDEAYDVKDKEYRSKHVTLVGRMQPRWPSEPKKPGGYGREDNEQEQAKYEQEMASYKPLKAEYDKWNKEYQKIQDADADYQEFRKTRFGTDRWEKKAEIMLECCKADAVVFQQENDGAFIALFSYSDNDGSLFTTMEHGDIFNALEHVRISHH